MIKLLKTVGAAVLISGAKGLDPESQKQSQVRLLNTADKIDSVSCCPNTNGPFAAPLSDCLEKEAKVFLKKNPRIVDNSFSNKIFILNGETIKCKIPSWNHVEFINYLVDTCSPIGSESSPVPSTTVPTAKTKPTTTVKTITTTSQNITADTKVTDPQTSNPTPFNPDNFITAAPGYFSNSTANPSIGVYEIAGISTVSVFFLGVVASAVVCIVKKKNQPTVKPQTPPIAVGKPMYMSPRV